jgi:transposase, IS5 family
LQDGFALVDNFSWDAYNESTDLAEQIENYRKRTGSLSDRLLADKIYGTHRKQELYEIK